MEATQIYVTYEGIIITREGMPIMFRNFFRNKKDTKTDAALEILFDEYYDRVYRTAYSIVLDVELAKEATQEAFTRAFSRIDTLRDKSKFGSWIKTITVNVCKDLLKNVIVNRQNNTSIYDYEGNLKSYIKELGEHRITPEKLYENIEMKHELQYCISQLDIQTQIIINLKYYHGFSYREIAEITNANENTVKTRLHRAKGKIAKSLEKHFDIKGVGSNV